jgi:isocitrate lyase
LLLVRMKIAISKSWRAAGSVPIRSIGVRLRGKATSATTSINSTNIPRGHRVLDDSVTQSNHDDWSTKFLQEEAAAIERWWKKDPRWKHTKRIYSAMDVACLRPSPEALGRRTKNHDSSHNQTSCGIDVYPKARFSSQQSTKLYHLLTRLFAKGGYSHTFGALDPVQVIQMASQGAQLSTVHVSGWQCSQTASTTNEMGPDFADYPYTTVPHKVDQLVRAQLHHDHKQHQARCKETVRWLQQQKRGGDENENENSTLPALVDYLNPIIADADTGHGGLSSVMKLTKLFLEAGTAAIHLEDQKGGTKKCGHLGGKVLVSTQEHIDRLIAARLISDIMGANLLVIARTDAKGATFLDNNMDPRDHPFILGVTTRNPHEKDIATQQPKEWTGERGQLRTFGEAVLDAIDQLPSSEASTDKKQSMKEQWMAAKPHTLSNIQARSLADNIFGQNDAIYFDWEKCRVSEGYYQIKPCLEHAIQRSLAFAPYADLSWAESGSPNLQEAATFSKAIHDVFPHQLLTYNLSPSFNWDASGMTSYDIASFNDDLGQLGYVLQILSLGGFHSNGLMATELARSFADRGILAYVEMIQRRERELNVDLLKHQKWSGVEMMDDMINVATGGATSTVAAGEGSTEVQFDK